MCLLLSVITDSFLIVFFFFLINIDLDNYILALSYIVTQSTLQYNWIIIMLHYYKS